MDPISSTIAGSPTLDDTDKISLEEEGGDTTVHSVPVRHSPLTMDALILSPLPRP